jgi:triosephosphate isomerase
MLVAGNWKMNTNRHQAIELAEAAVAAQREMGGEVEVAVMPPFPWLDVVASRLGGSDVLLGAQNVHEAESGAFTGEVSAAMLVEAGCRMVIVGHSERRHVMGETDSQVGRKVVAAQKHGLRPVLCVGETLEERDAGREGEVVAAQLAAGLAGANLAAGLVIAYEPVWAIGTGRTASPDQAQAMHRMIREHIQPIVGSEAVPILYGGSVKPANAAELFAQHDVDGGLIGGASLDAADFASIVGAAARGA